MQGQVKRREFLFCVGRRIGSIGAVSTVGLFGRQSGSFGQEPANERVPTTNEIRDYLLRNSPWVNLKNTVDTVKCGDPNRPVKKAGVAWFPSIWDIRAAIEAECDLLIVHEPTFWEHLAAEQHWRSFSDWFRPIGIEPAWLSGSQRLFGLNTPM